MTQPELLLNNGYTPRMVEAGLKLLDLRFANLKEQAQRLSRRPKAGRGRG